MAPCSGPSPEPRVACHNMGASRSSVLPWTRMPTCTPSRGPYAARTGKWKVGSHLEGGKIDRPSGLHGLSYGLQIPHGLKPADKASSRLFRMRVQFRQLYDGQDGRWNTWLLTFPW